MLKKIAVLILIILAIWHIDARAEESSNLVKGYATAYCLDGKTATGKEVRKGICATGHREWLGKTAIIYQRLPGDKIGDVIGIYEIEDTGCKDTVVDVWYPEDECQDFMNMVYADGCQGKVFIQIVDAEG